MDPDFMTRYLPPQGAEREAGQGRGEPVREPDVGESPSVDDEAPLTDSPSVDEPGAELDRGVDPYPTTVLGPDAVDQIRSGPAGAAAPAADGGPHGAAAGHGGGSHERVNGWPSPPDPERTTPVDHTAASATPAPEVAPWPTPHTQQAGPRRAESAASAHDKMAPPPARHHGGYRGPTGDVGLPPGRAGRPDPRGMAERSAAPRGAASTGPQPRVAEPGQGHGAPGWRSPQGPAAAAPWTPTETAPSHFRPDELTKSRKDPPEMGWRKAVHRGSGGLINLGAGPAEKTLRDHIALISSNIPGNYSIAFVSIKGGVGKTRTTAGIGTAFATYRSEPVLALDANPTYGSLGRVIDPAAAASIREYMADEQVHTYPKARSYTGKNRQGLEVLAGNQNVANPLALSGQLFVDTLSSVQRFYQLTLVDCGNHIEHQVMRGVLGSVDALVIVSSMNYDGAEAAEKTLDWLAARQMHGLLERSVLVLNDLNNCYSREFHKKVHDRLQTRVGAVTMVPFDRHLRDGADLNFDALRRQTRLSYIEIAAWLAQGFPTGRVGAR